MDKTTTTTACYTKTDELLRDHKHDSQQNNTIVTPERQKIIECIVRGDSKEYFSELYTVDDIRAMSDEKIKYLFSLYRAIQIKHMGSALSNSVIYMGSKCICTVLGLKKVSQLTDELQSNPFIKHVLNEIAFELHFKYAWVLPIVMIVIITVSQYIEESCQDKEENKISFDNQNTSVKNERDQERDYSSYEDRYRGEGHWGEEEEEEDYDPVM